MRRYRSILALILALVTTFLVSCSSGPGAKTPTTYTADKIAQIEDYGSKVIELREKMPVLQTKIQAQDWTNIGTFIHGPLGDLRRRMSYVSRELLPEDQKTAKAIAKEVFEHLESIDAASAEQNYEQAIKNYQAALKDFDDFLELIPTS